MRPVQWCYLVHSLAARVGLFSFKAGLSRGWEMDNKSSLKFERFHRTICRSWLEWQWKERNIIKTADAYIIFFLFYTTYVWNLFHVWMKVNKFSKPHFKFGRVECLHTENYLRHFTISILISNNFDNILQYNSDPVAYWVVCQKTVFSFWQSQSDI